MAFTNGTLLASGGDVYTQLMDLIKTFMETAGWTTNEYGDYDFKYAGDAYTGKKLHSSKSIGGFTRYINLRSISNQRVFNTTLAQQFSGIAAQGCNGYTGATQWDKMPEWTGGADINVNTTDTTGCGAVNIPTDNLSYWLFSTNSDDNIYIICQGTDGYTGVVFGVTSTGNYFVSGGSSSETGVPLSLLGHTILSYYSSSIANRGSFALRKSDDTEWWDWPQNGNDDSAIPRINQTNTTPHTSSIVDELLFCSPDNFKGNNPLIPSYIGVKSATGLIHAGTISGIKFVNMKFVDSLTELTFGGDTYILFRLYTVDDSNDSTIGLAILK